MVRLITTVIIALMLFMTNSLKAQSNSKIPCQEKEYKHFDFWIGDWNVYDKKGKLIGTNKIVRLPNACGFQENWTSKTSPNKGTSYNYYNKTNKTWNQLWIDNGGFSLTLKGNLKGNQMILSSETQKGKNGDFYNRVTWTNNADGTVTQVWDYMDTGGKVIQEAFRGIYKKKTN